jgi:SAM-dependent methyltransferase
MRRAMRRLRARILFRGNRVHCTVCRGRFSQWLGKAQIGYCANCGSGVRHRMLCLILDEDWALEAKVRDVVHFAPERCIEQRLRKDTNVGTYITADLSAPNVDVHTDLQKLIFPDCSFDTVVCGHVLEHIPDDRGAIAELYRILRPNGVAYIQVPFADDRLTEEDLLTTDPEERERRFGQFDHLRLYGTDLSERLAAPGFQVESLRPVRNMTAADATRLGLWDEVLFRCKKVAN